MDTSTLATPVCETVGFKKSVSNLFMSAVSHTGIADVDDPEGGITDIRNLVGREEMGVSMQQSSIESSNIVLFDRTIEWSQSVERPDMLPQDFALDVRTRNVNLQVLLETL